MNLFRDALKARVPLIAVPFTDRSAANAAVDAKAAGLDVAELRVDLFSSYDPAAVLATIRRFAGLPTIGTIRSKAEGGNWDRSEQQRASLFAAIMDDVDAVDIELSSSDILEPIVDDARRRDKIVIVSHHDFAATPSLERLNALAQQAKAAGADYVKIAAMAQSAADIQTLAQFTIANSALGLISIGMGPHGLCSRILFPALGSRLTFASLGQATAPGQLTFEQTFDMFRTLYPDYDRAKGADLKRLAYS